MTFMKLNPTPSPVIQRLLLLLRASVTKDPLGLINNAAWTATESFLEDITMDSEV